MKAFTKCLLAAGLFACGYVLARRLVAPLPDEAPPSLELPAGLDEASARLALQELDDQL